MPNSDSVLVKGSELRFHRKKQFSSAEAFAAACESVSVPTVYRAERGGPVLRIYLDRMAGELGIPSQSLVDQRDAKHRNGIAPVLTGAWSGMHLATDRLGKPHTLSENVLLDQRGTKVTGHSEYVSSDVHRSDRFVDCTFKSNVFTGKILSDNWSFPLECPVFVLSARRSTNWLQGFLTWFDLDTEQPEMSKYLLIRKDNPDFEKDICDARILLESEASMLRMRKLLESGYDFETANRLLNTL